MLFALPHIDHLPGLQINLQVRGPLVLGPGRLDGEYFKSGGYYGPHDGDGVDVDVDIAAIVRL